MGWLPDERGLERCAANYTPLSPLSHLRRAAEVYATRTALVYGRTRRSYADYAARVSALASALTRHEIRPGDVVATLLPNIPAQAEAHFAVPATGAILNTINTRLDPETVAYIFGHGGAKMVLVDSALLPLAEAAIKAMEGPAPRIIEVALLRKSALGLTISFPVPFQATASISALPRAEKRFMMAMRIWISAVWRSGSRDMIRSPKSLRQFICASTRLRTW